MSLDGWDPRTKTSAAIAKRQAADSLEALKNEYRDQVSTRVVKVFVYGESGRVKDMADYLDSKGAVVVDGQAMYNALAVPVEATIDPRARSFDSHQTLRLRQEYFDMAQILGLSEVPDLKTAQSDYDALMLTPDRTLEAVKKIIRRTAGDGLNQLYLAKKVVNDLLDAEVDANWVPVIITGGTQQEIVGLQGR